MTALSVQSLSGLEDGIVTPELAETQEDPDVTMVSSAGDQDP